jgi:hypothetical protein
MSTSAPEPEIDDVDVEDPEQLFYVDLLAMVKMFYRHDRKQGVNPSKKLVDYIKSAPRYGLTKALAEIRQTLVKTYNANRTDILDNYDDWIFTPDPLLLKVTHKIYFGIGNVYTRVAESHHDELHGALIRVMSHIATNPDDKAKLVALAGTKEKKASGGFGGLGGIGEMLSGLMGGSDGAGSDGLGSLMTDIVDQLKGAAGDVNDPSTLDPNAIGNLVKGLMTDKSENSFFNKMQQNPALASFTEKLQKGGHGK